MDLGLKDRVAIVTGSSRGIARAIAFSLAAEGARVVLNARGADALNQVERELMQQQGATSLAVAADVTTADGCQRPLDAALERVGPVHIPVNNAAGAIP